MRLLCLGPKEVMPPDDGGKEGIHGALAALAARADVTYAYPVDPARPAPLAAYSGINVRAVPVACPVREPLALVLASTLRLRPYKFTKHATPEAVDSFVAALRPLQFDAVVCFGAKVFRLAQRILERRGERVPVILREHNIEYALIESYARHLPMALRAAARLYAWITRREEQEIWRRADAVALLSDADMDAARASAVAGNFVLAREGVPLPRRRNAIWPGGTAPLLILFSPRVPQNVANLRLFFDRYWTRVASQALLPGAPLAITGMGKRDLAKLLRRSEGELDSLNVRALGFVDSLQDLFASSLALVSPTFAGGGVRKKVLEAMAHQLPVIATPLDAGTCSFYRPGVNILCMDSLDGLVAAVKRLSQEPTFWVSLGEAGRSTVERHAAWDRFAEALMAEATRLIDAPAARTSGRRALGVPQGATAR